MAVRIAHASISEKGTISGKAGDQTGKEVCIRTWYENSNGWVTLRCTVPGMAEHIAYAGEVIAKDDNVGYDQCQNQDLWKLLEKNNFDIKNIDSDVETDCARMARACIQYAAKMMGLNVTIPDFYTATMVSTLVKTGLFEKLTASKYNTQDDYLERGMLQCTPVKGHTWIILDDGDKVKKATTSTATTTKTTILKKGSKGAAVKTLQKNLISLGYSCGPRGDDGDFGSKTEEAVEEFQRDHGCEVDGEYGPESQKAMAEALNKKKCGKVVKVTGGSVNVRDKASTAGKIIFVARKGETYEYSGVTASNGWHGLKYKGKEYYISGKYSQLEGESSDDGEYVPKGKIADVSKWQGSIDWVKAASELDFCILRAANSFQSEDGKIDEYAKGCKDNGIPFGVYQYSKAKSVADAEKEANFLWDVAKEHKPIFWMYDCEEDGITREIVSAWVKRMKALGVEKIGLYIAHHRYAAYNLDVSEVDCVWIPRYGSNDGAQHTKPDYPCDLWQYTSAGSLAGVNGNVDLNVITGSGKNLSWFRGGE